MWNGKIQKCIVVLIVSQRTAVYVMTSTKAMTMNYYLGEVSKMENKKWRKFQLGLMTGDLEQKIKREATIKIEEFVPGIYEMTKKDTDVPEYVDNSKIASIMNVQSKCSTSEKIYIHISPFIVYNFHVEKDENINAGLM